MGTAAQQGQQRAHEWADAGKGSPKTSSEVEAARETASRNLYTDLSGFKGKHDVHGFDSERKAVSAQLEADGILPKVHMDAGENTRKFEVVGTTSDKKGMVVAVGRKSDGHAEQIVVLGADGKMHEAVPELAADGKTVKGYHQGRAYSEKDVHDLEHGKQPEKLWNVSTENGRTSYIDRTESGVPRHNGTSADGKHQSYSTETRQGPLGTETVITVQNGDQKLILRNDEWEPGKTTYVDLNTGKTYTVTEGRNGMVITPTEPGKPPITIICPHR
jgi:hypothetical protein